MTEQSIVWLLAQELFKDATPTFRQRVLIEEAKKMEEARLMEVADSAYEAGKLDKEFSNMFDNPKERFMNSIKNN
jgi:hypothetical protein